MYCTPTGIGGRVLFQAEAPLRLSLFRFGAEQCGERFAQLGRDGEAGFGFGVFDDEDLLEQGLVHESFDVFRGACVGGTDLLGEFERQAEVVLDVVEVSGGGPHGGAHGSQGGVDAVLFLLQEFEGDGVGVVGFQQLGLLSEEFVFFELQRPLACLKAQPEPRNE